MVPTIWIFFFCSLVFYFELYFSHESNQYSNLIYLVWFDHSIIKIPSHDISVRWITTNKISCRKKLTTIFTEDYILYLKFKKKKHTIITLVQDCNRVYSGLPSYAIIIRVRLTHVDAYFAAFSFELLFFFFCLIFTILAKYHTFFSWKLRSSSISFSPVYFWNVIFVNAHAVLKQLKSFPMF